MSKEYFPHDYNARNDLKMVELHQKYGMEGIGIYWCIVEMLYEEGGRIKLSMIDCIASSLSVEKSAIDCIIASNLFENDAEYFYSNAALIRLTKRQEISEKRSESASKRWNTDDSMQLHTTGNAIKVNKSKLNKSKVKEFASFWEAYPKKKNRGQAENAFLKVTTSIEVLLEALVVAAKSPDWLKEEGKYIPYPATWLNAKGWEDEYKPERKEKW